MSNEAINWALTRPIKHSTAKFVLVVMANCADADTWEAWPSVAHLSESTGQDRKTVLENIKRLLGMGYITDTAQRKGATKQVPIYRLNEAAAGAGSAADPIHYVYKMQDDATGRFYIGVRSCHGTAQADSYGGSGKWINTCAVKGIQLSKSVIETLPTRSDAESRERELIAACIGDELCMNLVIPNSPKNGPINSTENGTVQTVPNFPTKSPVFPYEQSQISVVTVPKTGHGTLIEPSNETKGKPKRASAKLALIPEIALPDWLPLEAWNGYLGMRQEKRKAPTAHAVTLVLADLARWHNAGHDVAAVLNASTKNGWTDVYEPKTPPPNAKGSQLGGVSQLGKAGQATARNMEAWLEQKLQEKNHA